MTRRPKDGAALLAAIFDRCERDAETGCLLWAGARGYRGTARIMHDGVCHAAHRLVYEAANGRRLQAGEVVRRICRRVECVEPTHLWAEYRPNVIAMTDAAASKLRGEGARQAKLSRFEVAAVYRSPLSVAELARRLRFAAPAISRIRAGRGWRHLRLCESGPPRGGSTLADRMILALAEVKAKLRR